MKKSCYECMYLDVHLTSRPVCGAEEKRANLKSFPFKSTTCPSWAEMITVTDDVLLDDTPLEGNKIEAPHKVTLSASGKREDSGRSAIALFGALVFVALLLMVALFLPGGLW